MPASAHRDPVEACSWGFHQPLQSWQLYAGAKAAVNWLARTISTMVMRFVTGDAMQENIAPHRYMD
jgi:hypothetical protein